LIGYSILLLVIGVCVCGCILGGVGEIWLLFLNLGKLENDEDR